jgi:hypothetical protein
LSFAKWGEKQNQTRKYAEDQAPAYDDLHHYSILIVFSFKVNHSTFHWWVCLSKE